MQCCRILRTTNMGMHIAEPIISVGNPKRRLMERRAVPPILASSLPRPSFPCLARPCPSPWWSPLVSICFSCRSMWRSWLAPIQKKLSSHPELPNPTIPSSKASASTSSFLPKYRCIVRSGLVLISVSFYDRCSDSTDEPSTSLPLKRSPMSHFASLARLSSRWLSCSRLSGFR